MNQGRSTPLTTAQIKQAAQAVIDVMAAIDLCSEAINPRVRQALAGRLDRDCVKHVRAVARGLQERPDLYPDIIIGGAELDGYQDEASAARELWWKLHVATSLAYDAYVMRQADCVDMARAVVRQVLATNKLPFRISKGNIARAEFLADAIDLQGRRARRAQATVRAVRRERLKAQRAAAEPPPLTEEERWKEFFKARPVKPASRRRAKP